MERTREEVINFPAAALATRHGRLVVSYCRTECERNLPVGVRLTGYSVKQDAATGKCVAVITTQE
jgi:hypothetical protein